MKSQKTSKSAADRRPKTAEKGHQVLYRKGNQPVEDSSDDSLSEEDEDELVNNDSTKGDENKNRVIKERLSEF